ncbi:MAG: hypothetical protein K6V97_03770 [Actinomycetia bacterium]|nr:hypothetical protein [Actinomycetes bacterium]
MTIIRPPQYAWAAAFEDVAAALVYALTALGHRVSYQDNNLRAEAQNIVPGGHLLNPAQWPLLDQVPVILYNFEQFPTQLAHFPGYDALLRRRYPLWDYAARNVAWLWDTWRLPAQHVPLGYVPVWTRLPPHPAKDIDVLFYGSQTPRRRAVLDRLAQAGLSVVAATDAYGLARDAYLARSRVVLNCHQFGPDDAPELVRLLYLWANRCAVVSEAATPEAVPDGYHDAAVWVPYEALAEACHALVRDVARQAQLGDAAWAAVQRQPFVATLARVLTTK